MTVLPVSIDEDETAESFLQTADVLVKKVLHRHSAFAAPQQDAAHEAKMQPENAVA